MSRSSCCCVIRCWASHFPTGFLDRHPEARTVATTSTVTSVARVPPFRQLLQGLPLELEGPAAGSTSARSARRTGAARPRCRRSPGAGRPAPHASSHWPTGSARRPFPRFTPMVRVVTRHRLRPARATPAKYIVLDISDWSFKQWMLLQMRHIEDYRAPVVLHPILLQALLPLPRRRRLGALPGRARLRQGRRLSRPSSATSSPGTSSASTRPSRTSRASSGATRTRATAPTRRTRTGTSGSECAPGSSSHSCVGSVLAGCAEAEPEPAPPPATSTEQSPEPTGETTGSDDPTDEPTDGLPRDPPRSTGARCPARWTTRSRSAAGGRCDGSRPATGSS